MLDVHLKKLHSAIESMTNCRKELCVSTNAFSKSVATLGNVEENDSVSRALARLAEVEEKVEALHEEQVRMRSNFQHNLLSFVMCDFFTVQQRLLCVWRDSKRLRCSLGIHQSTLPSIVPGHQSDSPHHHPRPPSSCV